MFSLLVNTYLYGIATFQYFSYCSTSKNTYFFLQIYSNNFLRRVSWSTVAQVAFYYHLSKWQRNLWCTSETQGALYLYYSVLTHFTPHRGSFSSSFPLNRLTSSRSLIYLSWYYLCVIKAFNLRSNFDSIDRVRNYGNIISLVGEWQALSLLLEAATSSATFQSLSGLILFLYL